MAAEKTPPEDHEEIDRQILGPFPHQALVGFRVTQERTYVAIPARPRDTHPQETKDRNGNAGHQEGVPE